MTAAVDGPIPGSMTAMSFNDLPHDWPARSLTDSTIARDVVDLVVRDTDRESGCICVLLCDAGARMVQPVTIDDVGDLPSRREVEGFFDMLLEQLGDQLATIVVALGRPHGHAPDDQARSWHEAAIAACRRHGVRLVATYLATDRGVMEMPRWEQLPAVG